MISQENILIYFPFVPLNEWVVAGPEYGNIVLHKSSQMRITGVIGQNCILGPGSHVEDGVEFENDVVIKSGCLINTYCKLKNGVVIGNGTKLGTGVVVEEGVKIGGFCYIGAGTVIEKDVPDFTMIEDKKLEF